MYVSILHKIDDSSLNHNRDHLCSPPMKFQLDAHSIFKWRNNYSQISQADFSPPLIETKYKPGLEGEKEIE